ncbi:MAG: MazG family protein [Streptosporangiales bacterium]|nr:MazG family protein [Streptosporangiales bacterium]
MGDSLVLLSTSHRVAVGLLSWPAWQAVHDAEQVLASDQAHPLREPLAAAGVQLATLADDDDPYVLARQLLDRVREATGSVVWCLRDDGEPDLVRALAEAVTADPVTAPSVGMLPGSYDVPGARFHDLVTVIDRLRSPGGCPWDGEQTHESLVRYLLEEAYELAEAIETDDRAAMREELGDVLMQVVFHARIASEDDEDPWDIDEVAGDIVAKLVSRHPHVFGDLDVRDAAHVEERWDALKAAEKGRASAVDGVPLAQPALALASKLIGRTERAGVDVPVEVPDALVPAGAAVDEEYVGELLLAVAALARRHGVDPEQALRRSVRGYRQRVHAAEQADRAE